MAFQNGDQVKFTYDGKQYAGEITDKQNNVYTVLYKGIFPIAFRTDSKVKIIKSDIAFVDGDIALEGGDIALDGEAAVQCAVEDLQASN